MPKTIGKVPVLVPVKIAARLDELAGLAGVPKSEMAAWVLREGLARVEREVEIRRRAMERVAQQRPAGGE